MKSALSLSDSLPLAFALLLLLLLAASAGCCCCRWASAFLAATGSGVSSPSSLSAAAVGTDASDLISSSSPELHAVQDFMMKMIINEISIDDGLMYMKWHGAAASAAVGTLAFRRVVILFT